MMKGRRQNRSAYSKVPGAPKLAIPWGMARKHFQCLAWGEVPHGPVNKGRSDDAGSSPPCLQKKGLQAVRHWATQQGDGPGVGAARFKSATDPALVARKPVSCMRSCSGKVGYTGILF